MIMGNAFIQPISVDDGFYNMVEEKQIISKIKSCLQFLEIKMDRYQTYDGFNT